jgi:hypothetical protein
LLACPLVDIVSRRRPRESRAGGNKVFYATTVFETLEPGVARVALPPGPLPK